MVEIPILGQVECTDGPCGTAAEVVIDFQARTITHVVVALDDVATMELLIPVALIVETTPELVRLSCTRQELEQQFAASSWSTRRHGRGVEPVAGSQALPRARRVAA
ncbi:MAG TPA: hypothetical protein VLC52_15540 [Anaerolineae bacterium]|nr:hypothetical protein [Anaerolineae bacterium]